MKVSLLNERITIEKSKIEVDKIGNHKNVWSKYYSCYATISSESPKEQTSSGATVSYTHLTLPTKRIV